MNTKIITLSSALLLLSATMLNAAELNCAKDPTGTMGQTLSSYYAREKCEEMGYTRYVDTNRESRYCGEGTVIYCPLDESRAWCIPKLPLKILYGDGTVSYYLLDGKTPIGIVFDETNHLAMTVYKKDYNIPEVQWSTTETQVWSTPCVNEDDFMTCRTSGQENTKDLLSKGANLYPAAKAASEYEPEGCEKDFCKKGKWFLPSVKEIWQFTAYWVYFDTIYDVLYNNGYKFPNNNYHGWSSNEAYGDDAAKKTCSLYWYSVSSTSKTYSKKVFPVVKY